MISFHRETKEFHLGNGKVSYIIRVLPNGHLENIYFGKAIGDKEDFGGLSEDGHRSHMSNCVPEPDELSLAYTRQEYPVYGTGDYRNPALDIIRENGSHVVEFIYQNYTVYKGKKTLGPLPATYTDQDDEAESLEILLYDQVMGTELVLTYTIFRDYPVVTRNTKVLQRKKENISLERIMSFSVELPDMEYEMLHLSGAWGRERYVKTRKLEMGIQSIQSLCGTCSSAEHNPFLALKRPWTTEDTGEAYGFSLVYSGNFLGEVEVNTFDVTRVMMGIHPQNFSWTLNGGEEFQTPEAVLVYSDEGLNGMSQIYHDLYRRRLVRGEWRDKARPILLNNWEATYFDFNEDKLLKIAAQAKEAGVELFVLDDGWFGKRNDDYRGLGDWYANLEKLPSGIRGLSEAIEAMGLKFGLWVELEMVNKNSDFYRRHPDWIITEPERFDCHARHQYVLDFSKGEVVDAIYQMIEAVLEDAKISYVKWDMNRYMTGGFSFGRDRASQGKLMHKYILGVYDLYRRLTERFPHILFESCASGGSRFDPGMLYFAPQVWTSDDTDAHERVKIQYGTSLVYPLVSMGSHVSAVPNHQIYRSTPLETRANVAYFGTFGYEMDLNLLSGPEFEQVKRQICFMKKWREVIQIKGDFYRLKSPFDGNDTAWMVVSKKRDKALLGVYQRLNKVNASWLRVRCRGLLPDQCYHVSCYLKDGQTELYRARGDELMYAGLLIEREKWNLMGGDFASLIYTIEAAD